jgi:hypothetical protein
MHFLLFYQHKRNDPVKPRYVAPSAHLVAAAAAQAAAAALAAADAGFCIGDRVEVRSPALTSPLSKTVVVSHVPF